MTDDRSPRSTVAHEERQAAVVVARILRVGMAASVALLAAGLALQLASGSRDAPTFHLSTLWEDAPTAERVMGAGIVCLAVTPAIVVGTVGALWLRQRDWRFAAVAAAVVGVLALAYFVGG